MQNALLEVSCARINSADLIFLKFIKTIHQLTDAIPLKYQWHSSYSCRLGYFPRHTVAMCILRLRQRIQLVGPSTLPSSSIKEFLYSMLRLRLPGKACCVQQAAPASAPAQF